MILRLFCPKCAYCAAKEKVQKGCSSISIDVPLPVARLEDDGKYEVRCAGGHVSTVIVDNVKFELLFELGLNAIVDGYPREAVTSFASALERFYEFYWNVVTEVYGISTGQAELAWKSAAKQSERQLGMYITAALLLTKQSPKLLNPSKDVKFRNDVIHGGYIPTRQEAAIFGDTVMGLINDSLAQLRALAPDALLAAYARLSPATDEANQPSTTPAPDSDWNDDEEHTGTVNILSAVDVRHPAMSEDDSRHGGIERQFERIWRDRNEHSLTLLDEVDQKK